MQILKNIWWLLTGAPTGITRCDENISCDYCGSDEGGITQYVQADFRVCQSCLKKSLDATLKH